MLELNDAPSQEEFSKAYEHEHIDKYFFYLPRKILLYNTFVRASSYFSQYCISYKPPARGLVNVYVLITIIDNAEKIHNKRCTLVTAFSNA